MLVPEEQQGSRPVRRGRGLQVLQVLRERPWAFAVLSWRSLSNGVRESNTLEVMQTMKPFSSILYDSTVLSSCRILPE
jgi:hypothetical protein